MKESAASSPAVYQRLESLDVLRGCDLFFLVALGPIVRSFARAVVERLYVALQPCGVGGLLSMGPDHAALPLYVGSLHAIRPVPFQK